MGWEAANARARGLATHLLTRDALCSAAVASGWESAARVLAERGYPLLERDFVSRGDLDRAVGLITARRLAVLGRWLGTRRASLAVVYGLDERRALRRLARGATQGISPEHRLFGLTPTPDLPEHVLNRLARAPSLEGLAAILVRAGHPAGRVLSPGGRHGMSLWEAELALDRLAAATMTRHARSGGRMVRRFTALSIDLENAWSLLGAGEWGQSVLPRDVFLAGGAALDLETYASLSAAKSGEARWRGLATCFAATPLASVFREPTPAGELEGLATRALVAWQRAEARRDPLSVATILSVLLRIRVEAHDARLVVFARDLGSPVPAITSNLETAA